MKYDTRNKFHKSIYFSWPGLWTFPSDRNQLKMQERVPDAVNGRGLREKSWAGSIGKHHDLPVSARIRIRAGNRPGFWRRLRDRRGAPRRARNSSISRTGNYRNDDGRFSAEREKGPGGAHGRSGREDNGFLVPGIAPKREGTGQGLGRDSPWKLSAIPIFGLARRRCKKTGCGFSLFETSFLIVFI